VLEGAEGVTTDEAEELDEAAEELDCEEADELDSEIDDAAEFAEDAGADEEESPEEDDDPPSELRGLHIDQLRVKVAGGLIWKTHHSPVPSAIVVGELFPVAPVLSVM